MGMMTPFLVISFIISVVTACSSCEGETTVYPRLTRRMQPEAQDAATPPKKPLNWGEINFIHTSDSHGWLEGHIKERNYGADWGDFVSFIHHMKDQATDKNVDLLLIDTGSFAR